MRFRLHPAERRAILLIGDVITASLSLILALYFWGLRDWLSFSRAFLDVRIPSWFFFMPFLWMILNVEMYDVRRAAHKSETIKGVAIAAGAGLLLYILIFFLSDPGSMPRRGVATFMITAALLEIIWRFFYITVFTAPEFMRRIIIVGAGRAGSNLAKVVSECHPSPFDVIGLVDDDSQKQKTHIESYPVLGGGEDLLSLIEKYRITDVIFAISGEMSNEMFQSLLQAEESGVEVTTMPVVYEELLGRVPIFLLRSDWILRSFVDEVHANGFYELLKRLIDFVGGLIGTLGLMLVYPFIALAIWLESGAPVIYTQTRLGKNGTEYKIIKFRTMREAFDDNHLPLPDEMRITKVGRILRKSHLDELPQFVNVLRGEMSLVGPRAERSALVNDLQNKVPFYRARLLVKPGITGWAQVNFGYATTVEDTAVKLEYDLYYIKHRNLLLDFVILLRTVGTVVGFRGQ